jgi:cathepsin B
MFTKTATLAAATLAAVASATPVEYTRIVKEVNSNPASTWVAEQPTRFNSTEDAKQLCGTWLKDHPKYFRNPERVEDENFKVAKPEDIPTDFDARTVWSNCTVISKVRDQSSCGSCWAFGSTESFEDRQCIATGKDIEMSSEDTAACCKGLFCGFSMGCNGGQPSAALSWMASTGVVTGGDFGDIGSGSSCLPYSLKPCAHHVPPSSKYAKCPSSEYPTPQCNKKCSESKYATDYTADKHKGSKAHSYSGIAKIQTALMTEGPLAVAFSVYSDFPTYKSGVYTHQSGQMLGGHAVEMIGWGVENGVDYWWIKNSWNDQWGDQGYFKIKRGTNECGIEGDVTGISF